jgi:hypothetical protein
MRIFMASSGNYTIAGNLTPAFVSVVCKWSVLCAQTLLLFTPRRMVPFWTVYCTRDQRRPAMMFIQSAVRKRGYRISRDCWVWHYTERKEVNCMAWLYFSVACIIISVWKSVLFALFCCVSFRIPFAFRLIF